MIINQKTSAGMDTAQINQLVPIFPASDMNPMAFGTANMGMGAGANTLPQTSGSPANPLSGMPLAGAANQVETILGIPPIAFYVLLFGAIAYILLWKVHWHAMVED